MEWHYIFWTFENSRPSDVLNCDEQTVMVWLKHSRRGDRPIMVDLPTLLITGGWNSDDEGLYIFWKE